MIKELVYGGKLIDQCGIPGETRSDGYFPGHINGTQLSRNRFLLFYTTRGWRGSDDNTSVIYQIRDGAYDGPLVKEGRLAQSIEGWDPLEDGRVYVKSHLHPLVFGVPKGAVFGGKVPDHAGLFTFMWHRYARYLEPETNYMPAGEGFYTLKSAFDASTVTEWTQLRLNEAEDDFEVVRPVEPMKQKGYESGYTFCEQDVRHLITTFVQPVPYSREGTEWIGSTSVFVSSDRGVAAMKFVFNPAKGAYEWTRMGPVSEVGMYEPSVVPYKDSWIVSARLWHKPENPMGGAVVWMNTDLPFEEISGPVFPSEPVSRSPSTVFTCADGRIRLMTNDKTVSPYPRHNRNPLYIWDIDPENGFLPTARHVVFDSSEKKMPIRENTGPVVDQGKVLPHAGGDTQIVAHRLRTNSRLHQYGDIATINEEERVVSGIYYSTLRYEQEYPALWSFG